MSQYWIWPVIPENWEILQEKNIWATKQRGATKKVRPGDYFVFYVGGTGTFAGSYVMKSDWYNSKELVWADEKREKRKIYHYECKLEPHIQGYAVYAELVPELQFVENKSVPQGYLRGAAGGPANFQRPVSQEDFHRIISAMQKRAPEPIVKEKEEGETEHDTIITQLLEIGTSLGFESSDSREQTYVAKGAILDATWITRIANLGEIRYAFEVQRKGQLDSSILNLLKASANPSVRRLFVVASRDQIEKIRGETESLGTEFKSKLSFWSTEDVRDLHEAVDKLDKQKQKLGIGL